MLKISYFRLDTILDALFVDQIPICVAGSHAKQNPNALHDFSYFLEAENLPTKVIEKSDYPGFPQCRVRERTSPV
jgi:hypothetical protein